MRHLVARAVQVGGVTVEAFLVQRLREREQILALGQFHRLLAQHLFVAKDPHFGGLRPVGVNKESRFKRLPLLNPVR